MDKMPVALCQMRVGEDKSINLDTAQKMVAKAAEKGARLIVLPEIFNSPYEAARFSQYSEPIPGPSSQLLQGLACQYQVTLVGGSIIERDPQGKLFNTCLVYAPDGSMVGKYRKIHLFDVNIPGKIRFQESATLSPGHNLTLFSVQGWQVAVLICYDIRFPELLRLAVLAGADAIVVPAAFNLTTGPLHWDLLMRSRAVDSQAYVMACSPALNQAASYKAWGHSMLVDPRGTVLSQAGQEEVIVQGELYPQAVERVRSEFPLLIQRRTDLYDTVARQEAVIIRKEF